MSTPANWYPDPQTPGVVRWWDGSQWTSHSQAVDRAPAQAVLIEGWYPDPELRGVDRWWDGSGWTEKLRNTPEQVRVVRDEHRAEWRPDPELRGVDRWWDGRQWTDHRRNHPG